MLMLAYCNAIVILYSAVTILFVVSIMTLWSYQFDSFDLSLVIPVDTTILIVV